MGSAHLYLTGNTLKGHPMRPSGRNLDELRPISIETGVMRHADAGYDIAIECAREQGLNLPMVAATQGDKA